MRREDLTDLAAFMVVAEERSFTRAADRLGTSQSALSHGMRRLETRLGQRLLTRTTRSVAPTEAGERLLKGLVPALRSIESEVAALNDDRGRPTGRIVVAAPRHAAETLLWPAIERVLVAHPDIHVELRIDGVPSDDRVDATVGLGETVVKDMSTVRIGGDVRMAVVASPAYLASRSAPTTPEDLAEHECINLRPAVGSDFGVWNFRRNGRDVTVVGDGRVAFNDVGMVIRAAEAGLGLGFVPEDQVARKLAGGGLLRFLEDWCPPIPGYHLHRPSGGEPSAALALLVDELRSHD